MPSNIDHENNADGRRVVRARLDEFRDRLTDATREAADRFPDLQNHDLARFAVVDLLPNRVFLARICMEPVTTSDAEHLDSFLTYIETGTIGQIGAANNAADVADAIVHAAEDLHSYLLGHEIVDQRYGHLSAGSLFRRAESSAAATPSPDAWAASVNKTADSVATCVATDSHEYALAA